MEQLLSLDFTFSAPPDPFLDRDGYFERTEVLTFNGGQIARAEVYFGWDVR